jgi:hypothetical protein
MLLKFLDEAFAAAGVGVATVHEAMEKHFVEFIFGSDVAEGENMVERRVYAAV